LNNSLRELILFPLLLLVPNEPEVGAGECFADHWVGKRVIEADHPMVDAHVETEKRVRTRHFEEAIRVHLYLFVLLFIRFDE
jgi:hypothetical protein